MRIFFEKLSVEARGLLSQYSKSLACLLVLSGLFGAIMGTSTATWQHPIETAQVLLGLVSYDPSSLSYAYHASLFSWLNYIACLFLAITDSEISSSILLAAVLGVMAMQVVAMVIFLILRNVYISIAITLLLAALHFFGLGISYPIFFMGTEHAYGRAGLFFIVYAVLMLAFSKYRTGFLFCGLAIGMHPAWGACLSICLTLIFALRWKEFRYLLSKQNAVYYLVGLGVTLMLFVWQKIHYPVTVDDISVNQEVAREIFVNYIKYWDHHRQKFDQIGILSGGFLYASVSLVLALFLIRAERVTQNINNGAVLFFTFMVVATVFLWPFVFIPSWFDPEAFPAALITAMPGRFINISIFLCTPLLMAVLYKYRKNFAWTHYILVFALLYVMASFRYGNKIAALLLGLSGGLIGFSLYGYRRFILQSQKCVQIQTWGILIAIMLVFLAPAYLIYKFQTVKKHNFQVLSIPSGVNGSILVTMENYMIQSATRLSSISPHIDGYSYIGKSGILLELNRFTVDMFDISMLHPAPATLSLHGSVIATKDYKSLWESRKCGEWEKLAIEYHFDFILVPKDMYLQLSKADNDPLWNKYFPRCATP